MACDKTIVANHLGKVNISLGAATVQLVDDFKELLTLFAVKGVITQERVRHGGKEI